MFIKLHFSNLEPQLRFKLNYPFPSAKSIMGCCRGKNNVDDVDSDDTPTRGRRGCCCRCCGGCWSCCCGARFATILVGLFGLTLAAAAVAGPVYVHQVTEEKDYERLFPFLNLGEDMLRSLVNDLREHDIIPDHQSNDTRPGWDKEETYE